MRGLRNLIIGLAVIGIAGTANATIITFDGIASSGTSFDILSNPFDVGEYSFAAVNGSNPSVVTIQTGSAFYAGSDSLTVSNSGDLLLTRIDGGLFDVSSIDVQGAFSSDFEFVALSGSLTQFYTVSTFSLETVNLIGFVGINSLLITGGGAFGLSNAGSIDNINVVATPVPEPSTLTLLAFGLAGLGFMTRRRRREAVAA